MKDWFVTLIQVGVVACVCLFGWIMAHHTIATECQKLGAFYVGSTVYECKEKK
jgi:hypothetical protein